MLQTQSQTVPTIKWQLIKFRRIHYVGHFSKHPEPRWLSSKENTFYLWQLAGGTRLFFYKLDVVMVKVVNTFWFFKVSVYSLSHILWVTSNLVFQIFKRLFVDNYQSLEIWAQLQCSIIIILLLHIFIERVIVLEARYLILLKIARNGQYFFIVIIFCIKIPLRFKIFFCVIWNPVINGWQWWFIRCCFCNLFWWLWDSDGAWQVLNLQIAWRV